MAVGGAGPLPPPVIRLDTGDRDVEKIVEAPDRITHELREVREEMRRENFNNGVMSTVKSAVTTYGGAACMCFAGVCSRLCG